MAKKCAPSMTKSTAKGGLIKGAKGGKGGFIASPAPMVKKGK